MRLFDERDAPAGREELAEGAALLRGFALAGEAELLRDLSAVTSAAGFRHMVTPGGYRMSVAMTNCGRLGWVSDRSGYRYAPLDPLTGLPWPAMPDSFAALSKKAAEECGFAAFDPDACLVNQYTPGAKLSLHQDRDEKNFTAPIVSVSLGLPAVFQFGGLRRRDALRRVPLYHGDVVVWGGPSRLVYHGVLPLKEGTHAVMGPHRVNLTLRRAG
jgi:DNA oxidative demethylase